MGSKSTYYDDPDKLEKRPVHRQTPGQVPIGRMTAVGQTDEKVSQASTNELLQQVTRGNNFEGLTSSESHTRKYTYLNGNSNKLIDIDSEIIGHTIRKGILRSYRGNQAGVWASGGEILLEGRGGSVGWPLLQSFTLCHG